MEARIIALPGDGCGPEVIAEGKKVLDLNPCYAPLLARQGALEKRFGSRVEGERLANRALRFLGQIAR